MDMVKKSLVTVLCVAFAPLCLAQEFRLTVGPPIAGNAPRVKFAQFVVRADGCADPANARVSAMAEGKVGGARRSVPVALTALPTAGVYAVSRSWTDTPGDEVWLVNLTATCRSLNAGALIPVGPNGFIRESARFFPRPATREEVDSLLNALSVNRGAK
jgi:hypothetical protein